METIGEVIRRTIPDSKNSGGSVSSSSDGLGCERCGREDGLNLPALTHRCCYCGDGGRIRDPQKVGATVVCPRCSGGSADVYEPAPAYVRMMIPGKFREACFEEWAPATGKPRTTAQEYARDFPPQKPLLAFTGNKGTGKTTLACAILRVVDEQKKVRGQFWPVIDLLDRYRRTFDGDRATETLDDVDQQMRRVPLLVLDDYGAHKGTDFAEERLFALIDYRYREEKPTVITSNVSLMEMAERVYSRLTDTKVSQVINFMGKDMRPEAGK